MIPNTNEVYADFVKQLFNNKCSIGGLAHAAMGISGESGELLDAVKKHVVYGKPLDMVNVVEELGDLLFYVFAMMQEVGVTYDSVLDVNMQKLTKRYPNLTYTDKDAIERKDKEYEVDWHKMNEEVKNGNSNNIVC